MFIWLDFTGYSKTMGLAWRNTGLSSSYGARVCVCLLFSLCFFLDDLDISEDFFDYMAAGERLMAQDKSLWCVSAWNDNGKAGFIDTDHPELLHRTDFFPGLGWMLKRAVWDELSPKWPKAFWDDWMRNPAQRKDRACLSPEISRTYTFGLVGVSQGQYWKQHLQYIQINNKPVKFNQLNLDYLLKTQYDEAFDKAVYGSPEVAFSGIPLNGAKSVRVLYANNIDFKMKAKKLGIMDDLRVRLLCILCVCVCGGGGGGGLHWIEYFSML